MDFRVWDIKEKRYAERQYFFLHSSGRICQTYKGEIIATDQSRYKVEFFTGRFNDFGDKLYEGDVVKIWFVGVWIGDYGIGYNNKSVRFQLESMFDDTTTPLLALSQFRILGNVNEWND